MWRAFTDWKVCGDACTTDDCCCYRRVEDDVSGGASLTGEAVVMPVSLKIAVAVITDAW